MILVGLLYSADWTRGLYLRTGLADWIHFHALARKNTGWLQDQSKKTIILYQQELITDATN